MPLKLIFKSMIIHLVVNAIFWINVFPPSKSGAGLSNNKRHGQLFLITVVDHKNLFCLQPGEYDQVHQDYEPENTIDVDQKVGAIILGPKYNLQNGYFFKAS